MKAQLSIIFLTVIIATNLYPQYDNTMIGLAKVIEKKMNLLTDDGLYTIEEKTENYDEDDIDALAIGINLYKANLMTTYLTEPTNEEMIKIFVEKYLTTLEREIALVPEMTLSETEKNAYSILHLDEKKVILNDLKSKIIK